MIDQRKTLNRLKRELRNDVDYFLGMIFIIRARKVGLDRKIRRIRKLHEEISEQIGNRGIIFK